MLLPVWSNLAKATSTWNRKEFEKNENVFKISGLAYSKLSFSHLFCRQVLADFLELLGMTSVITFISRCEFHILDILCLNIVESTTQQDNKAIFLAHLFGDHPIPILVHVLEKLFYGTFLLISYHWKRKKKKSYLAHEFLKAKPSVKVAVHRAKEVLHLLPEFSNGSLSNYFSLLSPCGWHPAWIENTQPLLIR